jgi:enoyl-CoA hydratase/carnithine racemase
MSALVTKFEHVLWEEHSGFAVITINRPQVFNTLSVETLDELTDLFRSLTERRDLLAVVLWGCDDEAFAAGADIREVGLLDGLTAIGFARRVFFSQKAVSSSGAVEKMLARC